MNQKEKITIVVLLLFFVSFFGVFASDMYLPSLPNMARSFHISKHTAQLTITYYLLSMAVSQLFYGPCADRFGRKPVLLIGMTLGFLGSLVCAFSPSVNVLILGRFIQGMGAGAGNVLFRAILRDTFSGKELSKVAAWTTTLYSLAPAIAPVIGGYIEVSFGWRMDFIFLSTYVFFSIISIAYFLPETHYHFDPFATKFSVVAKNYHTIFTNKHFLAYTGCSAAVMAGFFAYMTASPFLFQVLLGVSPVEYGWLALVCVLASMAGKLLNVSLIAFFSEDQLILFGIMWMLISGGSLLLTDVFGWLNLWVILIPAMLYIFAGGFVFTNALSGAFMPFPEMAGAVGAVYGFIQMIAAFLGSLIIASWHTHNQFPLAVIFTILAVGSLWLFRVCQK